MCPTGFLMGGSREGFDVLWCYVVICCVLYSGDVAGVGSSLLLVMVVLNCCSRC